MNRLFVQFV